VKHRLTLVHVFYLSLVALTLLLGGLFAVLLEGSRRSVEHGAEQLRDAFSDRIGDEVLRELGVAEKVLRDLERQIQSGTCRTDDPLSLESTFFAAVLNNPQLSEATLTVAPRPGETGPVWQISLLREGPDEGSPILTERTTREGARFVSDLRRRAPEAGLLGAPLKRQAAEAPDPKEHVTFTVAAGPAYGRLIWTDLSWCAQDQALPEAQRRVVWTAMKTVEDRTGRFVGVLRVGSRAEQIDRVAGMRLGSFAGNDPHVKFLFDPEGRLLTRLAPEDRLYDAGDALRIKPVRLPPEIDLALHHPLAAQISPQRARASGELVADGRRYLVSFRSLANAEGRLPNGGIEDWRIGIVVPDEAYLGGLRATRNRLLLGAALLMAAILAGGALSLGAVRRGLERIVRETARMRRFEFTAAAPTSPFADVREAMESLELAKTAMRAMGKYVPVDLVRELYQSNREPVLGGRLLEVTLMFTDIEGFTSLAERLSPDRLAEALGHYLEAMTAAIDETGGTVDKYIGDAVMAMWNAPRPTPDHAERACRAALLCTSAARRLFDSPAWQGLPPLVTRFGLHRDTVMIGHFGAPNRLSFTALGDGVNLASRIEGLNKQYGTVLLATEPVRNAAGEGFVFRRLDRVAVKGKTQGTLVYELLGAAEEVGNDRREQARRYEASLDAYFARDFAGALRGLEALPDDPPSCVLAERCRALIASPPPDTWDGIYVARSK
jgi:adenylate cyclase